MDTVTISQLLMMSPEVVMGVVNSPDGSEYRRELQSQYVQSQCWLRETWDQLQLDATEMLTRIMSDPKLKVGEALRVIGEILDRHPDRRFARTVKVDERSEVSVHVESSAERVRGLVSDWGKTEGLMNERGEVLLPDALIEDTPTSTPVGVTAPSGVTGITEDLF